MKWTTEKPTKEGWYWYRQYRNNGIRKGSFYPPRIAEVEAGLMIWEFMTEDAYTNVIDLNGQWSGPIQPPQEI